MYQGPVAYRYSTHILFLYCNQVILGGITCIESNHGVCEREKERATKKPHLAIKVINTFDPLCNLKNHVTY